MKSTLHVTKQDLHVHYWVDFVQFRKTVDLCVRTLETEIKS